MDAFPRKHAPCQEMAVFSKRAVTHYNFKTWEMLLAALWGAGCGKNATFALADFRKS
jgi:hypothetical protein